MKYLYDCFKCGNVFVAQEYIDKKTCPCCDFQSLEHNCIAPIDALGDL